MGIASRGAMNSLLYVAMLALLTLGSCTPSLSVVDRARAHASKPRSTLTGPDFSSMTASLNQQIQSLGASTRDCSSFTIPELHQLIKVLMASKHDGLQIIYQASLDQRGLLHSTIPSLELHWLQEAAILAAHPDLATISRDGKCHLAVLLFAHHLSQPAREQVRSLSTLPLLPKQHHDQNKFLTSAPPLRGEVSHRVAAVEAVHRDYARASSCADGHIIGTGQSSWVKGCLGSEECPVWPAEFSAPFGMYSTLPPIKNASSTFYYKVHEDGTKRQLVDYSTYCFPFVNLLHYHQPCKLYFQPEGIFLSQPGHVDCCQFNAANVSAVPLQFLHAFTLKGTNVTSTDYYGNKVSTDYWEGPLGFKYWTVNHYDKLYKNWGHDIVFQDGPTGVTWQWGNFDLSPQADSVFQLPKSLAECSQKCPTF